MSQNEKISHKKSYFLKIFKSQREVNFNFFTDETYLLNFSGPSFTFHLKCTSHSLKSNAKKIFHHNIS